MWPDPAVTVAVLLLAVAIGAAVWWAERPEDAHVSPSRYRRLVRQHVGHSAGGVALALLLAAIVVRCLRGGL